MNLERPQLAACSFGGILGERLIGNRRNWLLVAPLANPAMVEMFDHSIVPRPGSPYLPAVPAPGGTVHVISTREATCVSRACLSPDGTATGGSVLCGMG